MLVSMPPGTWAVRILASMPRSEPSNLAYFLRTPRKYDAISSSSPRSMPVSRSPPSRMATIDSVAEWP